MPIDRTEMQSIEKIGKEKNRRAIDRTAELYFCHTYHGKAGQIMTYHDMS